MKSLSKGYMKEKRLGTVVLDKPVICENIPLVQKVHQIDELKAKKISISDTDEEVLISADVAGRLLTGKRKLSCNLVAIETYLNWTQIGNVPQNDVYGKSDAMVLTYLFVMGDSGKIEYR